VLAASPKPEKPPAEERVVALLDRYVAAMQYAGLALEWKEGVVLHLEEALDPERLDPWIKAWAGRADPAEPEAVPIPPSALATGRLSLDFPALLAALRLIVPETEKPRIENLLEALRGIALGRDLATDILPKLGPGVWAYVEAPDANDSSLGLPFVLSVRISKESDVGVALENVLRTLLAFYALDEKHGGGRLRLGAREHDGVSVIALEPATPMAFAVCAGRLVLGRSPEAVSRALASDQGARRGESVLERIRRSQCPPSGSFACIDLVAVKATIDAHRAKVVKRLAARNHRSQETEAHDLDQVMALMGLFQGAYLTSAIAPDASSVHRTLGLIARTPRP
jgi:hypothetical protein